MISLASPIQVRNHRVKNRIVLPPLVVCGLHPDGQVNAAVVAHYSGFAQGGCGIIIQEATCVSANGKLAGEQLGIWQDSQIEQAKRIVAACLPYDPLLLIQIHHASKQGEPDQVVQVGPSPYVNSDGRHRELSLAEIEVIRDDFVAAAVRAEKSGYHGIELHGAHGYLLCAFMNPKLNQRMDRFGDPLQLVGEIIGGIRQSVKSDFLVTIRIGLDNPDPSVGLSQCQELEKMGIDLLNVSSGMAQEQRLEIPEGFPFSELAWRGCEAKRHVSVPVIAVGDLNDPVRAARLVGEGYADFAAVGRGMLVDPEWANKALAGQPIHPCLDCRDCVWFRHHQKCPGRKRAER